MSREKIEPTNPYLFNHHEPIVDNDLRDRTQEELLKCSPSEEQNSKYSNRYWCSDKLICSSCGCEFVHIKTTSDDYWQCNKKYLYGSLKQDKNGTCIGCNTNDIDIQILSFCMNYCINLVLNDVSGLKQQILKKILKVQKQTKEKYDQEYIDLKQKNEKLIQNNLDIFSQTIGEILSRNQANEEIYKELLNKIIVSNNIIDIWLNNLPVGIRFTYTTLGEGHNCSTTITGHSYSND